MKIKKVKKVGKRRVRLATGDRAIRNAEIRKEHSAGKSITQIAKERKMSYIGVRYIIKTTKEAVSTPETAQPVEGSVN